MPRLATLSYICCKGLSQLRFLELSWASHEPVIFRDTLARLTQLGTMSLALPDFNALEQLPAHVTFLTLHAWEHLDMAAASCLQRGSS